MSLSLASSIRTVLSGITSEVALLRDEANNRVGAREVARSFVNSNLTKMATLVEGTHIVSFKDDRGEWQAKEQSRNHSIWTVALQTTIETGHTSYALLGSILSQWAKDALGVEWPRETSDRVAKMYVTEMQMIGILDTKLAEVEFIDDNTHERRTSRVAKLSATFDEMMNAEVDTIREATSMLCKPLRNQP